MSEEQLVQRGKQFRADIKKTFDELQGPKRNKNHRGNYDVSNVVSKYIPNGTTFRDAEVILKAAGVELAPMPPRPPQPNLEEWQKDFDDRFSILGGITLSRWLLGSAWFAVTLYPERPGEAENTVKSARGLIGDDTL